MKKLYEEKADKLKFIIDDCDFGIKRVKDMMKQNNVTSNRSC